MEQCPYCDFELNRPTKHRTSRTDALPGGKSPGSELVSCPDCDRIIDGFSAH